MGSQVSSGYSVFLIHQSNGLELKSWIAVWKHGGSAAQESRWEDRNKNEHKMNKHLVSFVWKNYIQSLYISKVLKNSEYSDPSKSFIWI